MKQSKLTILGETAGLFWLAAPRKNASGKDKALDREYYQRAGIVG